MNLRDLQYLEAVCRLRHFGHAAAECHVSQPTLSMQIKKLEGELGVTLLERGHKKNVLPTPAGARIVEIARRMIDDGQSLRRLARAAQDPLAGEYTIGAFPTLAPFLFPRLIPGLRKSLPKLRLFLDEEKTLTLVEKLKDGRLDAAFLAVPVNDAALASATVFRENFYLACPRQHRLARAKKISSGDLEGETLLLLEQGHCLSGQALEVCALSGAVANPHFRASSIETLRQMAASGLGVTLIPATAIGVRTDNLVYIPFHKPAPGRTIALFWRNGSPFKSLFERLVLEAKKAIPSGIDCQL